VQKLYDTGPGHLIDLQHRQRIVERKPSLGDEVVNCYEDRNLDQARSGESLVTTTADPPAGPEIYDAVANDSTVRIGDRIQGAAKSGGIRSNHRLTSSGRAGTGSARHSTGEEDRDIGRRDAKAS
jgi:hypothetical protein